MKRSKYVDRVIKQVEDFWLKQEEGFINWDHVSDDFFANKSKREMQMTYGFTPYQYKILKKYMVGK